MNIKNIFTRILLPLACTSTLMACQTSSITNDKRCLATSNDAAKESRKCVTQLTEKDPKDPENLYLEEVYGKKALSWVESHNESSRPQFENDSRFTEIKNAALKVMDDPNKLIHVAFSGDWAYNFWQDEKNVRGLWRRTSIENYLSGKSDWEVLLDIDALAKKENKNWIFGGSQRFKNRALISLSDGGKDAKVVREFDISAKSFVTDGFILPEGKNSVSWINENELFLGLAVGQDEVTDSGYPRKIRIWKRGEAYQKAAVVYTGDKKDVSVKAGAIRDQEDSPTRYKMIGRSIDFFNVESFILRDNGQLVKLDLPTDANIEVDIDQLFVTLKSPWHYKNKNYEVGTLIKMGLEEFISGSAKPAIVFKPTKTQFLQSSVLHKGRVFLNLSDDVNSLVVEAIPSGRKWKLKELKLPKNSAISFAAYSNKHDLITFSSEGFLAPQTIFNFDLSTGKITTIDQAPSYFDSTQYVVKQIFTKSKDGTKIPYYIVHKKGLKLDGKNPTIINAYGGFEVTKAPYYSAITELAWLKNGGVWISANIRGGGEYGPAWHKAVLKENRQLVYEDFFAVAEDVIRKKISSPEHLGAVGGSNGGLLMGVAMTQRPELYNAIAIQVPLLDMLRYHKLLAGASWVGEYGDPEDPKMRAVIERYSPYQNVREGKQYPEVFFMTSTADDRVHPGHARRTAAKMEEQGHPFFYYENTEGGHGGSANNSQRAKWSALQFIYFLQKLK